MSGNLFGFDDDEYLDDDLSSVVERYVDNFDEGQDIPPFVVSEFPRQPNRRFLPSVELLVDRGLSWLEDDVGEEWYESAANVAQHPEVVEAFETAIQRWADKITWTHAGPPCARHHISIFYLNNGEWTWLATRTELVGGDE